MKDERRQEENIQPCNATGMALMDQYGRNELPATPTGEAPFSRPRRCARQILGRVARLAQLATNLTLLLLICT